jgi:hypothetical protein
VAICLLLSSLRGGTTWQSFCFSVSIMRLLRSYFPRNNNGLRHCETFLRRGNLFVIIVIARRHDAAICLFLSFNHEITSVILSS